MPFRVCADGANLTAALAQWPALIETNKVIVSNTRWPLEVDWTFCDFIRNYTKPEYADSLYVVSALSEPGVQLGRHLQMPEVLRCAEIHEAVHHTRLWMSSGGTSSSLHFDTHENLMLQIDGTKTVTLWPPSQSHLTYMDYHDRYGLSPVHPDRVDLDKWPLFAALKGGVVATLHAGDALFIPDGWWHAVRTHDARNVAVTWEFEPYEGLEALWPDSERAFRQFLDESLWSSQVRLKYRMKHAVTKRGGRIACNGTLPAPSTADSFQCGENFRTARNCNFQCLPQTCVTQQCAAASDHPPTLASRATPSAEPQTAGA